MEKSGGGEGICILVILPRIVWLEAASKFDECVLAHSVALQTQQQQAAFVLLGTACRVVKLVCTNVGIWKVLEKPGI